MANLLATLFAVGVADASSKGAAAAATQVEDLRPSKGAVTASSINLILTDATHTLSPLPAVAWNTSGACPATGAIVIDHGVEHQVVGGFGASLTESSAINLNALPASQQEALLALLFGRGPADGARLSAVKTTMLANDFAAAAPWATYDGVAAWGSGDMLANQH